MEMLGYVDDSIFVTKDTVFTKYLQVESIQIKTVVITAGRRSQEIEEVPISMEIIKPSLIESKGSGILLFDKISFGIHFLELFIN